MEHFDVLAYSKLNAKIVNQSFLISVNRVIIWFTGQVPTPKRGIYLLQCVFIFLQIVLASSKQQWIFRVCAFILHDTFHVLFYGFNAPKNIMSHNFWRMPTWHRKQIVNMLLYSIIWLFLNLCKLWCALYDEHNLHQLRNNLSLSWWYLLIWMNFYLVNLLDIDFLNEKTFRPQRTIKICRVFPIWGFANFYMFTCVPTPSRY